MFACMHVCVYVHIISILNLFFYPFFFLAVHVVMYGYYLSTVLSFPIRFIKRYITLFQMTQFALNMVQASYDLFYFKYLYPELVGYPFNLTIILWVYMWTMLGLFANFFKEDRKREKGASADKKGQ